MIARLRARAVRPLPWRVMRTTGRTATETCRHRWERMAEWCARGKTRRAPTGVFHVVLPAVDRD